MNLICQYLQSRETYAQVPAGKGLLLCINASPDEAAFYRSLGWTTQVVALSPGIVDLWKHDSSVLTINPWKPEPIPSARRFDALAWNDTCALFASYPNLLDRLLFLLNPHGKAYLQMRHAGYMKHALRASGREMLRWPWHSPCEYGITISQLESSALWPGFQTLERNEIMDSSYLDAFENNRGRIKGYDSYYELSGGAEAHRRRFIKGWNVVVKRG